MTDRNDAEGAPVDGFTKDSPVAPPEAARRRVLPDGLVGWGAIAGVIVSLGAAAGFAFDLDRAGTVSFWIFAIAPTVVVAVLALVRAARDGELVELVRPEWGDATRGILSAALLLGGTVAFVHVVAPAGSPQESWTARIYLQLGDPGWLRAHQPLVVLFVFVAAAAEEIVWRGLVTRLIAERIGSRSAWLWAAVAYALAQVPTAWALQDPQAGKNPMLVAGALALGLAWGAMARWSGRLAPSVLSHAAFDWCVIMLFRLWGAGV
jgi:membrane protease YdiL (CAAX protease family)